MSEFKFNDEPYIDMPADDARAQLEAAARSEVEALAQELNFRGIDECRKRTLIKLLFSFARAHGEAQYRAGLEAAMGIADAEANHWADFGNYKSTKARADSASDITKKIRALIEAAQDGKAGE